jgi:hypothetical protein
MTLDEVRRAMKRATTSQRAEILEGIPNCVWKARHAISLHKHLFLDYLSGEWVLSSLVAYYNLQKDKRLTGLFKINGTLTVRGATSALEGILRKIADEPDLRQQLRDWSAARPSTAPEDSGTVGEVAEFPIGELIPAASKCGFDGEHTSSTRSPGDSVIVEAAAA